MRVCTYLYIYIKGGDMRWVIDFTDKQWGALGIQPYGYVAKDMKMSG